MKLYIYVIMLYFKINEKKRQTFSIATESFFLILLVFNVTEIK